VFDARPRTGCYAPRAQALDQVALRIHEGECVSPVGLNGAGKTSSFNPVSGRVP